MANDNNRYGISIIVPVFNVEKYLPRCIESLLAQTYKDFEIILVDDGSTDGCPNICDWYEHRYSNVRVYHKRNGARLRHVIMGWIKSIARMLHLLIVMIMCTHYI